MRWLDFEFDFNVIAWNLLCSTHKLRCWYEFTVVRVYIGTSWLPVVRVDFATSLQWYDRELTIKRSHDLDHNTPPRVLQKSERSTQSRYHIKGRPLTPTKYRNEEEPQKPCKRCTSVRSPCMLELLCHKTEHIDGT
jgi:hypothetical protein